ncbi:sugar phosphate nucleotidyltransferase [Collimonas pratensis]|uniref:sugar phosphate nucleotidyltransferase n=1 Tax=Collimonas pratensis TaxID=279113 RepID=UPI0026A51EA8
MSNVKIIPVILCGGSGTRLWPISRKSFPKQFAPLIGNKSLLQLTLERVAKVNGTATIAEVICVAAEDYRFLVSEAMQTAKVKGAIILEPAARNTAAAMALAALKAAPKIYCSFVLPITIFPTRMHLPPWLSKVFLPPVKAPLSLLA